MIPFPTRTETCTLPILSGSAYRGVDNIGFLRLHIDKIRFLRELNRILQTDQCKHRGKEDTNMFQDIITQSNGARERDLYETWLDIITYPNERYNHCCGNNLAEDWRAADSASADD